MSFALTAPQFRARTKFVTRRYGWLFLCTVEGPVASEFAPVAIPAGAWQEGDPTYMART